MSSETHQELKLMKILLIIMNLTVSTIHNKWIRYVSQRSNMLYFVMNVVSPDLLSYRSIYCYLYHILHNVKSNFRSFSICFFSCTDGCVKLQEFCLNGGSCRWNKLQGVPYCECPADFDGDKCQSKHIPLTSVP